ncbi:hypothetical protein IMSAG025_01510 [Muribaculaceae bacterium]|nr:hypothetical protein IMSAG025_01510 [Muribaculaceae bacterium]
MLKNPPSISLVLPQISSLGYTSIYIYRIIISFFISSVNSIFVFSFVFCNLFVTFPVTVQPFG